MVRIVRIFVVIVLVECVLRILGIVIMVVKMGGLEEVVIYNVFKIVLNVV